jgi:hypothetical protein
MNARRRYDGEILMSDDRSFSTKMPMAFKRISSAAVPERR